jgi:thymidylate synthase
MNGYLDLLTRVAGTGKPRPSRVGHTVQRFGEILEIPIGDTLPVLTTRQIFWRPVLGELAAFLEAAEHVDRFKQLGCNYWDADAKRWGRDGWLGRIYGVQWRSWRTGSGVYDQLRALVEGLRSDPHGRRHILTAWNPGELDEMALPPCHVLAQFNVDDDKLDCAVYMRSVDLCLGLPADMILYGALLHLVAEEVHKAAGKLTFFFGDCHVYQEHIPVMLQQLRRQPRDQPRWYNPAGNGLFNFDPGRVDLVNYSHYAPLSYRLLT